MKLRELIEVINPISVRGDLNVEVTGLCHDSRTFQPGNLFMAIRGNQFDGHLFVGEACARGACGFILEDEKVIPINYKGPIIKVKATRPAVDLLASKFYNYPSEKMFIAAVTGTNGKTTTTHMIESVLNPDFSTAVMGTIDYHLGTKIQPSSHTTPDAIQTQKLFNTWVGMGATAVSMEVSSHALAFSRVDSVHFDAAVFTNLTRDHLDLHKTMAEYEKTKAKLFLELLKKSKKKSKRAIINGDDPHHQAMIAENIPLWIYGSKKGDIKIKSMKLGLDETLFELETPMGNQEFNLKMIGLHNIYNAMAAVGVGLHAGINLKVMSDRLSQLASVKGRLERVESKSPVRVFVDYAHSDDALKNVLSFLRELKNELFPQNKLITVFGCGGDRDKGKRPMMMKAAEIYSDRVVVTSDNPRTEKPELIIDDILQGANPLKIADNVVQVEVDRRKAIELAIEKADPGDVVLIAGKGHEDYQIVGTKKFPFDDYKTAKDVLNR